MIFSDHSVRDRVSNVQGFLLSREFCRIYPKGVISCTELSFIHGTLQGLSIRGR
jgi:hypothetical protein